MSKPNPSSTTAECVKVMIRVRPMNTKEKNLGCASIVDVDAKLGQICLKKVDPTKKEPPKLFTYDAVFHTDATQRGIYEEAGFPLVESVIEGYNGTIFAYGQTGCGKTHTMVGPKDASPDSRGIIDKIGIILISKSVSIPIE